MVAEGLVLPGWFCSACRVFNGEAKFQLLCCRACDEPRWGWKRIRVRLVRDIPWNDGKGSWKIGTCWMVEYHREGSFQLRRWAGRAFLVARRDDLEVYQKTLPLGAKRRKT